MKNLAVIPMCRAFVHCRRPRLTAWVVHCDDTTNGLALIKIKGFGEYTEMILALQHMFSCCRKSRLGGFDDAAAIYLRVKKIRGDSITTINAHTSFAEQRKASYARKTYNRSAR
jgi:hypothetical protein